MTETKYLEYIFHLSKKFKQRETTQPLPKKFKRLSMYKDTYSKRKNSNF